MIPAWKKLWPALGVCEPVADSEQDARVVEDIVSLGQFISLEVDKEDVEELVKEHNTERTTEKLQDLHIEQQQEVAEELSSRRRKTMRAASPLQTSRNYWGTGLRHRIL